MSIVIGTAGWSIPLTEAVRFPAEGSSLERYAARFRGAEINSSFHRPHRRSTWERWAASVPDGFRFSVKLPRTITHQHKLVGCGELLRTHLAEASLLGDKLAVHLVQLPPSLTFDTAAAEASSGCCGRRARRRSPASRATLPGSSRRPTPCSNGAGSPAWRRTRRVSSQPPAPAAGPASLTFGCTARPSCTGRAMMMAAWRPMPRRSGPPAPPKLGASSTTPPLRPRPATR